MIIRNREGFPGGPICDSRCGLGKEASLHAANDDRAVADGGGGKGGRWSEATTCGISISADRTQVSIYLGGAEPGETFEFIMPKDLALHMANTIQRLASPAVKAFPKAI